MWKNNSVLNRKVTMNAFYLKWLAVILMVVDHIGYFIFPDLLILRMIGRLSFPIFAFLIANGYQHTRDVKKYVLRLFIFANVIQLASIFMIFPVNIFYTLTLGLLCIIIYDIDMGYLNKLLMIAGLLIIAYLIKCDYGPYGVLMILIVYIFRERYLYMALFMALIGIGYYGLYHIQNLAILSIFFFMLYNNKEGRKMKYFFYVFYPLHMMILFFISEQLR